jgi:hypothetical protein
MTWLRSLWLLLIFHLFTSVCWAGNYRLFTEERPMRGFTHIVQSLKEGDQVFFSNGRSFVLGPLLGKGNTTLVFALKEDPTHVLRLPLELEKINYMSGFIIGGEELAKDGIPTVQIEEAFGYEYAVVERLTDFMTFTDFVKAASLSPTKIFMKLGLSKKREVPLQEMMKSFDIFSQRIASYSQIGDMHADNLVYDFEKKEWRLIDWTGNHNDAQFRISGQIFYHNESPLENLLLHYGRTRGLNFQADSRKYAWLEKMINEAHATILQQRQRTAAAGLCAKVFTR